jgi:hypothetical protein
MLVRSQVDVGDERGTTIVELLVGLAMGMVVLVGLTMVIIVTLHGNARVDARVEATQNARTTVTKVMEELHSACILPKIAPVLKESTGKNLIFWHAANGETEAVEPNPVKTEITYKEGALWQTNYALTGGESPTEWTFRNKGQGEVQKLIDGVKQPAEGEVFSYYRYEGGTLGTNPMTLTESGLSETNANEIILVKMALAAEPATTPVRDADAGTTVFDSASLRLTPPSFNEVIPALPCT